jgi:hypothetical protein
MKRDGRDERRRTREARQGESGVICGVWVAEVGGLIVSFTHQRECLGSAYSLYPFEVNP